MSFNFNVEF